MGDDTCILHVIAMDIRIVLLELVHSRRQPPVALRTMEGDLEQLDTQRSAGGSQVLILSKSPRRARKSIRSRLDQQLGRVLLPHSGLYQVVPLGSIGFAQFHQQQQQHVPRRSEECLSFIDGLHTFSQNDSFLIFQQYNTILAGYVHSV
jgi:hypothetical protein